MKIFNVFICFVLLISNIYIVKGESQNKMEKNSLVSLLDNGILKIETIYKIEPGFDTFITSEAIKSAESLRDITIEINGKKIPETQYKQYIIADGYKYIALNQSLITFEDINKTNEVYVKYEINISNISKSYQFKIELLEVCQLTSPEADVNYSVIIQSFDGNYIPTILGNQDDFKIEQSQRFVTLYRSYKSYKFQEKKRIIHINNLFFINSKIKPLGTSAKTIVIDIKNKLIKEIYNYESKKVEGENPNQFLQYEFPESVLPSSFPKIKINNRNDFAGRINYDDLKKKLEFGNFTEPFYYLGKGLNSNENTLYVGYNSNEAKNEVNIEFEYTSNKVLTSEDEFHYIFNYYIFPPRHTSNYIEFLNIEIPEEFNIDKSNYEYINLGKESSERPNKLRFKFMNQSDFKSGELKIEFSRNNTKLFDYIKIVDILLSFCVINLLLLWLFRIIPFENLYLDKLLEIIGFIIVTSISLGIFFGSNYGATIKYTYFWIPILLEILVFIIREYIRRI